MKFNKKMPLFALAVIAMLGSCNNKPADTEKPATSNPAPTTDKQSEDVKPTENAYQPDLTEKLDLNLSVFYKNDGSTNISFPSASTSTIKLPYTGADGNIYQANDLKPVWKELQKRLNVKFNDLHSSDKEIKDHFKTLVTNHFKVGENTIHVAQGNSVDIIAEGTNNKTLIDLNKYLNKLPNYSKFLKENPVIQKVISNNDGEMFYAPYFDGYDDIERMLMVRVDWVKELLDGELPTGLDTAKNLLSKSYTPFYTENVDIKIKAVKKDGSGTQEIAKKHTAAENIIAAQNALTTMNGATMVKALRDYIDKTYNGYYGEKRSDLFCGVDAAYDVDELVALYRCVYACPQFLTGDATKTMVPFFPRETKNSRTADLWRLTQFFGVRGGESRNGYLYVGDDGKIHDTRNEEKFRDALKKLNEMYKEGLILQNFTSKLGEASDFRKTLLQNDTGFSSYDYNQTSTILNNDARCKELNGGNFTYASILPAVADWTDNGKLDMKFYTESWRSVKPQGWFITAETAKDAKLLDRALALVDYMYSDEGNTLMSYGPKGYVETDASGNVVTINYQGKQVPKLSDNCKKQMADLVGGNYTNYYRYYVGATYPVGYVKQQGMEYQTVAAKAVPYLDNINKAIELGVLEHVNHLTGNTNDLYSIVPATFAFTAAENNTLAGTDFTKLGTLFSQDNGKKCLFSNIVMEGFGTYESLDLSYENYITTMSTAEGLKLDSFVKLYNDAYARMGL